MSLGHSPARKGRTGGDLEYFVEKYRVKYKSRVAKLPEELLAALSRYHWPGTVRQLESVIKTVSASP
jgi:transcriptional regulator with PAS, ATPase and Fis domain